MTSDLCADDGQPSRIGVAMSSNDELRLKIRGYAHVQEALRPMLLDEIMADIAALQLSAVESKKIVWPQGREAGRMGDMTKLGYSHMRVGLDFDNDVYVSIYNGETESVACLEFCNGGGGGGKSMNTRLGLIALMVAMEKDSAISPERAFPRIYKKGEA